jgi:hypothetical protein
MAEILAGVAGIIECIDRVWSEGERPLVARQRLDEPSLSPENIAEIVMKSRLSAVSRNRFAKAFDRNLRAAELMLDNPEQVQGLRMIAADHKDLMTKPLGLSQPTGLL